MPFSAILLIFWKRYSETSTENYRSRLWDAQNKWQCHWTVTHVTWQQHFIFNCDCHSLFQLRLRSLNFCHSSFCCSGLICRIFQWILLRKIIQKLHLIWYRNKNSWKLSSSFERYCTIVYSICEI